MTKKALVTGASEGIGRAFATRLAREGWAVTAVARNEARLQELVKELGGAPHTFQAADLSTEDGAARIARLVEQGGFDLLVNNAGFGTYGDFPELELDRLRQMVRLNVEALMVLSHAFLKNAKKGDALLNVSSTLAFLPMPAGQVYAATKAFVTSFTESLWFQQKKRGVYVMGLCPGITESQFAVRAGLNAKELPRALTQKPEEVVDVAMRALKRRGSATVISGPKNAALAFVTRALSRRRVVEMMGAARH